jgi:hypothetical protein
MASGVVSDGADQYPILATANRSVHFGSQQIMEIFSLPSSLGLCSLQYVDASDPRIMNVPVGGIIPFDLARRS